MFCAPPPMNPLLVKPPAHEPGRRGTLRAMQNAAQYSSPLPGARPILMGPGIGPIGAGVSAPWRRLLQQAEMAAPHLQVAAIEGEHGVGKQTLARCLQSRSPLAGLPFHR